MKEIRVGLVGLVAKVDDEDYELLSKMKWVACHGRGKVYARTYLKGSGRNASKVPMHRIIMKAPKDLWVDHVDGDGLNNQKTNLRLANRYQNQQNRGKNKNNSSGYKGVSLFKRDNKWDARIEAFGVKYNLGRFSTPKEAHEAYVFACKQLHKDFSNPFQ